MMFLQKITELPSNDEIKTELIRKTIHFFIAFVPGLAYFNKLFTILILIIGILLYVLFEL